MSGGADLRIRLAVEGAAQAQAALTALQNALGDLARGSAGMAAANARLGQSGAGAAGAANGQAAANNAAANAARNAQGEIDRLTRANAAGANAARAAQAEIDRLTRATTGSGAAMRGAGDAAGAFKNAMGGLLAAFGASQLIGLTDQYTKFTAQLRLATSGASDYANAMQSVRQISSQSQQDIGAVGVLYARIANGTRELGISQKQLADITSVVGLSLAVSGATASESSSAMLQLSQAFASGVLRGEEFNAVNEAAPRLMKALADGIGQPVGALKKMAEAGQLTAEVMAVALPKALKEVTEEAKEVATISGAFTALNNEVMQFVGASAGSSGAIKAITTSVVALAENLNVVATVAGTLVAVKLANWATAGVTSIVAMTAANSALLASNLAVAQSEVTATASASVLATARLAEVRAAVLASAGNVQLALVTNGLIPAQAAAATAAAAHATAMGTLAAAQGAATISTRVLNAALSFVGSPLGLIITALGVGAAAWLAWGNNAKKGTEEAAGAVQATTQEILANLDKQNAKLEDRLALIRAGNVELGKSETPASEDAGRLLREINALKEKGNKLSGVEQIVLIEKIGLYDDLNKKTQRTATLQTEIAQGLQGNKASEWLGKYATNAEKLTAELAKARKELGDAFSPEIEKRIRAQYAEKKGGAAGAVAAVKKEASEYDKLIASIRGKITANDEEIKGGGKLTDADKLRIKLTAELDQGTRKMTAARLADANAQLTQLAASEQALAVFKAQQKFEEQRDKSAADIAADIGKINEKAQALEDEADAYGMTAKALQALAITRLDDRKAMLQQFDGSKDVVAQIDEQIDAMNRLGDAGESLAGKKLGASADEVLRNAREQAKLYAEETGMAQLTGLERAKIAATRKIELDYAKRIAEVDKSGASDAEKLAAKLVLGEGQQIESAAAVQKAVSEDWQKTADSINTSLTDALMRGFESGKDFGKNLKDTLVNMFKTLILRPTISAILAPVAGGLSGMANAAVGGGGGALSNLSSLTNIFGSTSFANAIGAGIANATGTGISGLLATNGAYGTATGAAGSLGASFSAAMPWLLGGVAVAALWKPLFGRKLKDSGVEGTFGGERGFEGNSYEFLKGGLFRSNKTNTNPLDEEVRKGLGDAFGAMRTQVTGFATALGLNADSIAGFTSTIKLSLKDLKPEEAEKKIQEALGAAGTALAAQMLGANSPFSKAGEEAGATLSRLAGSLLTVNAVFDTLGTTALTASLASGDLASKLTDAFGGIEAFATATGTYYEAFYSEQERTETGVRQLTATLAKLGIALPDVAAETALAQYRALVDQQDINTESGRTAYAALVNLSGGFAQLTTTLATLRDEERDLLIDLFEVSTGDATEANLMRLRAETLGMTEAESAQYEYNAALKEQVQQIKKTVDANKGWQDQIDVLMGKETDRSIALRDAGDVSTRALMKVVNGLNDMANASAKAASAAAAAAAANKVAATAAAVLPPSLSVGASSGSSAASIDALRANALSGLAGLDVLGTTLSKDFASFLAAKSTGVLETATAAIGPVVASLAALESAAQANSVSFPTAVQKAIAAAASTASKAVSDQLAAPSDAGFLLAESSINALTAAVAAAAPTAEQIAAALNLANTNQGILDQTGVINGSLTQRDIELRDAPDESTKTLLRAKYEAEDVAAAAAAAVESVVSAVAAIAPTLDDVKARLLGVNNDIARVGFSGFELALAEIQDRADEAAAAFGSMAPEIVQLAEAERTLLNARNAATATATVGGLQTEIDRINFTALQNQLAGIDDSQAGYIKGLVDIGQATAENTAVVDLWATTMRGAAVAAEAAALAATNASWQDQIDTLTGKETERSLALRDAGDDSTRALMRVVYALQDTTAEAEKQANTRAGFERQLLELNGDTAALRLLDIAGMDAANVALFDRVAALGLEQTAAAAATAEAEKQANTRAGFERQLLELSGDTAALRLLDIAGMDARNVALFDQITALQAAQTAEQSLASARTQAAQEYYGLETRLLQLQGDTAGLRARELAQLDPANRAIQEHIWRLEDQAAAATAGASALTSAAESSRAAAQSLAEQARALWKSITEGLVDEVRRIRGELAGDAGMGMAYAQAQFAVATAQARAGDQTAAENLPGLSKTLLDLAQAQATTLVELQRIRAQTAGSLMQTAARTSSRAGMSVPKFDVGTNYVPQDMLAMIHKGEAIVPERFNPSAFGMGAGAGTGTNAELVAAIAALQRQVAALQQHLQNIEGHASRTSQSSATTAAVLEDAQRGRRELRVTVV